MDAALSETPFETPQRLYTCDQVATLCLVKRVTVWNWIRKGYLRAFKRPGLVALAVTAYDLADFQRRYFRHRHNRRKKPGHEDSAWASP